MKKGMERKVTHAAESVQRREGREIEMKKGDQDKEYAPRSTRGNGGKRDDHKQRVTNKNRFLIQGYLTSGEWY